MARRRDTPQTPPGVRAHHATWRVGRPGGWGDLASGIGGWLGDLDSKVRFRGANPDNGIGRVRRPSSSSWME